MEPMLLGCWMRLLAGRRAAWPMLLSCILFLNSVRAQSPAERADFVLDTWQTEAGLPHNSVTAIVQTRDGYLWLGTANGLARFDGTRFTVLRGVDNPGLKSNHILCLYEDTQGVLWVGTEGGGVARYGRGEFTALTMAEGLSSDTVLCLGQDQAGDFWVGTDSGLGRSGGEDLGHFFKTEGLADKQVYAICQRKGGAVLFATQQGLYRFAQEQLRPYPAAGSEPLGRSAIYCLQEDGRGRLWAGGELGLFLLEGSGATNSVMSSKIPWAKVMTLFEGPDAQIWFGTSAGELYCVAPHASAQEPRLVWQFKSAVTALRADHEGNLWVGTAGHGLHRLKAAQLRWAPFSEGLNEARVACLFETAEGEPGLLTADKRLYRCRNGSFTFLERLPLPDGVAVQTVCAAARGELWLGTLGDGLFQYQQGALRHFGERNGLSDSAVSVLCAEVGGGLWVSTRNGGLNYLKDGAVTRFNTPWGLMGNFACALAKDQQSNLWIGTTGDGLFRLSGGSFVRYAQANGLPSGYIHVLHADRAGSLWVGTAKGLCRVKAGRITAFGGRNGLQEEAVLQLCSDGENHLWVGTSSGIFRLRKDQLEALAAGQANRLDAVAYGKEDGLPVAQCLPRIDSPGARGRGGGVWFATAKGLVLGQARGLRWNTVPPPVLLEAVLVENESVPLLGLIRVPPGKDSLQFRFTALSFAAPGKVSFRYQLEGFDRDWSEAAASRSARYTRLPPGSYRFRVSACNNDGVWNETGASVALVVTPFWWATAWFRLTLIGAGVGLVAGLYRSRQIRRRELERLRVRIAGDLHDDIGSSLWSITLLSRMLAKSPALGAAEQQDIAEINRISVETSNAIRDMIWLINPAFDTLQDLVLRTKDFAGTTLRGIEYQLQCEGVDLSQKLPLDFRQNLFLFFKEALTNVARHARATAVEVRILQEPPGRWRFEIRDNGRGFDPVAETPGNGLKNLCARAQKLGARLQIQSLPGEGTTLVFTADKP